MVREDQESESLVLCVKHNTVVLEYNIDNQRNGCYSVIVPESEDEDENLYEHIFNSVEDLIIFYSDNKEVLCTKLGRPCLYASEWKIRPDEIDWQVCNSTNSNVEYLQGLCGAQSVAAKKIKSLINPQESVNEEVDVLKG